MTREGAGDDDRAPAWRRYARFLSGNPARDVDEELDFHLQSTIDELVGAGMSREAAHDAARRKFGDVDSIGQTLYTLSRQRERTMRRTEWWQTIKQDVVFGLRQLRKAPGFTAAALATLALGIGANSAIFSVVYSVMLKPLPFANSNRIITISETTNGANANAATFGNYASWRDDAHTLEAISAQWLGGSRTLTGRGDPAPVSDPLDDRGLVEGAVHPTSRRPLLWRRRRADRRAARRRHLVQAVAEPIQRRPCHPRQANHAQRDRLHGRRRRPGRVLDRRAGRDGVAATQDRAGEVARPQRPRADRPRTRQA